MGLKTFCVALLASMVSLQGVSYAAGPRLGLSTEVWDLGEIYQWTEPSTTVEITNLGGETLKITDVKVSCGCTAFLLDKREIGPGEKGILKIELASHTVTGRVSKLVKLFTNDPAAAQKDIAIRGFVRPDKAGVAALDKDYLDLGVVAPYEVRKIDALISNRGNEELEIRDIELPRGYSMESALPGKIRKRFGIQTIFEYRPPVAKGPIDDVITINTSGINGGVLKLRIVGYVDEGARGGDMVLITPSGFSSHLDGPIEVVVKNDGRSPVTVEEPESSIGLAGVKISAPEIAPGEAGTISLELEGNGLEQRDKGYVYIRLGLPVEAPATPAPVEQKTVQPAEEDILPEAAEAAD